MYFAFIHLARMDDQQTKRIHTKAPHSSNGLKCFHTHLQGSTIPHKLCNDIPGRWSTSRINFLSLCFVLIVNYLFPLSGHLFASYVALFHSLEMYIILLVVYFMSVLLQDLSQFSSKAISVSAQNITSAKN